MALYSCMLAVQTSELMAHIYLQISHIQSIIYADMFIIRNKQLKTNRWLCQWEVFIISYTWGDVRPDPEGEVLSNWSKDSLDPWEDVDLSNPCLRTDVTLGGGRGPSSNPSPLLLKLVGRDLLGDPEGVRELIFLSGIVGGLSLF